MRSEQQYITFYQQQKDIINKQCPESINSIREKAFEIFSESGFPVFGSEDYQHTNIPALLAPNYGMNIHNLDYPLNPEDVFCCDIPNLSTDLHFVVNDSYHQNKISSSIPAGVFAGGLNDFSRAYPDVFSLHYGKLTAMEKDGLSAFNSMFVRDGFVLYIPKNAVVEKPIQLINVLSGKTDTLATRRILIIVEEGASGKLLVCDHTMEEQPAFAVTQVCEVFVGNNASFDLYELEESSSNTIRLSSCYVKQGSSSRVMIDNITLINGFTRNNFYVSLEGEYGENHLYGMAITDEEKQVDNATCIEHKVPHCQSDELFKYILDDKSIGVFSGKIIVDPDAQKTQAYQNNKNLSMSKDSRMFAKPQLEIYADDVKCSHGLTTGQLDENALFYMRSRGIPEEEARLLLKFAFTHDIIDGIRLDGLKDRLKMLVEKRFRGELMKCRSCSKNKNT